MQARDDEGLNRNCSSSKQGKSGQSQDNFGGKDYRTLKGKEK